MHREFISKKVHVSAYSGYRLNERPKFILMDDRRLEIRDIQEKWVEPEKDYFKVLADDGKVYILSWSRYSDQWFIEGKPAPYSEV